MTNGSERVTEYPKAKAIHHSYVVPGLTDGQVMKSQAQKNVLKGQTTWVHQHARLETCDDKCEVFEPRTEEQEDDAKQA